MSGTQQKNKDYCTGFFEEWFAWDKEWFIRRIDLSELCKVHDENCSSTTFFKLLWKHKVVGGLLIGLVASIACWIRYTKHMIKRI